MTTPPRRALCRNTVTAIAVATLALAASCSPPPAMPDPDPTQQCLGNCTPSLGDMLQPPAQGPDLLMAADLTPPPPACMMPVNLSGFTWHCEIPDVFSADCTDFSADKNSSPCQVVGTCDHGFRCSAASVNVNEDGRSFTCDFGKGLNPPTNVSCSHS